MIPVRGRIPPVWETARTQIQERLQAIERELSGSRAVFATPATPSFGSGSGVVQPSTPPSGGGGGGVIDHGLLIGLSDDDHPQYAQREEIGETSPHIHGENDVTGLESRFPIRGETVPPEPHLHMASDVADFESRAALKGEETPALPHVHSLAEVPDFNLWEMMLWQEVYGG